MAPPSARCWKGWVFLSCIPPCSRMRQEQISAELRACADEKKIGLIVTTGGTGLSPRDVTPEATLAVLDREIRAIPVAMWVEGLKATPRAMLSRAVAGTRGSSLILNLPGSEKAARENLSAVHRCARTRHAHASRRRPRLSCPPQGFSLQGAAHILECSKRCFVAARLFFFLCTTAMGSVII